MAVVRVFVQMTPGSDCDLAVSGDPIASDVSCPSPNSPLLPPPIGQPAIKTNTGSRLKTTNSNIYYSTLCTPQFQIQVLSCPSKSEMVIGLLQSDNFSPQ